MLTIAGGVLIALAVWTVLVGLLTTAMDAPSKPYDPNKRPWWLARWVRAYERWQDGW